MATGDVLRIGASGDQEFSPPLPTWVVEDNSASATLELVNGEITASIVVAPVTPAIELNIGPTATGGADRTKLQIGADGSVFLGTTALSSFTLGADGTTGIGAGGFATYIYGLFNGVATPEVPANPTPQDIADALVALGLITQAV